MKVYYVVLITLYYCLEKPKYPKAAIRYAIFARLVSKP